MTSKFNRYIVVPVCVCAAIASLALCVVTSANAATTNASVGFYLSAPGVQGSSLTGGSLESFGAYDSVSALSPTTLSLPTTLAVGSVTAGTMKTAFTGVGAVSTNDTAVAWNQGLGSGSAIGYVDANRTATITLGTPRNYFGFLWLAGDGGNTLVLRSGGREVATFSTRDIISLVPKTAGTVSAIGGATYTKTDYYGSRYYGSSSCGAPCNEPFAYIHAVAPAGVTFDEVEFRQGPGGGFEFDNIVVANYTSPFDLAGLVGVPVDQLTDDSFSVAASGTLNESVATNDTILAGSTFSILTNPSLGSATLSSSGALTFAAGATAGTTSFQYKVCRPSPSTTCVTATVTITITGGSGSTTTTVASNSGSGAGGSTQSVTDDSERLPSTGTPIGMLAMLALVSIAFGSMLVARRDARLAE